MQEWHVEGINEADVLAAGAAALDCVPEGEANKVMNIYKGLELIHTSLKCSFKEHITQTSYIPCKDKLIQQLRTSQHDCVLHNNRLHGFGGNCSIRSYKSETCQ